MSTCVKIQWTKFLGESNKGKRCVTLSMTAIAVTESVADLNFFPVFEVVKTHSQGDEAYFLEDL